MNNHHRPSVPALVIVALLWNFGAGVWSAPPQRPAASAARRPLRPIDRELVRAAHRGEADRVRDLLRRGADPRAEVLPPPHQASNWDGTVLQNAAGSGRADVVRLVLDAGAPVDQRGPDGTTPLFDAGSAEVAALLLARGAHVDALWGGYTTPLLMLCMGGGPEAVPVARVLLENGADVTVRDHAQFRMTPLMWAASRGDTPLATLLLDHGASPNDCYTATVLYLAAGWGDAGLVKLLLDRGACPNFRIGTSETALMKAAEGGKEETVRVLLAAGARTDLKDFLGKTALDYARENDHEAIAALLAGSQKGR